MADSSPEPPLTVTDAQLYGLLEGVHEALIQHGAPLLPGSLAAHLPYPGAVRARSLRTGSDGDIDEQLQW